ncbi:MAG: septal ring lytic transglycosylase RlpA family protein [Candidatus Kapabacteria bacterium]|nr:septal ring lytic transglycosylase RlpA family protein [Candidatus Kapabacteria bacterium]
MTTSISQKNIARFIVFAVVVAIAMSISFLVQAHDAPDLSAPVSAAAEVVELAAPVPVPMTDVADGLASWYGGTFHGRRTASGQRYDMDAFTAAHRTLPFGTLLRVRNVETGKVALVEITDRGPFIRRRVVDLSRAAARFLGVSVSPVEVEALTKEAFEDLVASNPDGSVVLDADMRPHSVPDNAVTVIERETSLKDAVTSLRDGQYLRVELTERGIYTYERVRIRPVPVRPLIAQK